MTDINALLSNLEALTVGTPVTTNSIRNFDSSTISNDAANTHIIIHPRFPDLVNAFLTYKRSYGESYLTRTLPLV